MKIIAIAAALLGLAGALPAQGADMYKSGGSLKDAPYTPDTRNDHTGWALRGFLGYATGDRDINSDADAFLNCTNAYDLSKLSAEERAQAVKEIEAGVAAINDYGIFATHSGDGTMGKVVVPIIGALFRHSDSDDFSSLVFGAEVEHLWQSGQFGVGIAPSITGYANGGSRTSFSGAPTYFASGTLTNPEGHPGLDGETGLTVSGFASVERQYDIDLALKLYYFASQDLAFFAKAGPSIAFAKVKGGVSVDGTDAGFEYEHDETSIGFVVGGGVIKWIDPSWSVSLDGDWKRHSFEASGNHSESLGAARCLCDDVSIDAHGKTEATDNVVTIKAATAYHF